MTDVKVGTRESLYLFPQEHNTSTLDFMDFPFPYFVIQRCLGHDFEQAILEWFDADAPWKLVETDFYEQFEFSLLHTSLPRALASLVEPKSLCALRKTMGTLFNQEFSDRMTVLAHKLVPGQRIAIHNDHLEGHETHRLTIQINRGLQDDNGGYFVLFNTSDPGDIHRILRPISGSALGFEIGENSNHAVSKLHSGQRYTLVYSFYANP